MKHIRRVKLQIAYNKQKLSKEHLIELLREMAHIEGVMELGKVRKHCHCKNGGK